MLWFNQRELVIAASMPYLFTHVFHCTCKRSISLVHITSVTTHSCVPLIQSLTLFIFSCFAADGVSMPPQSKIMLLWADEQVEQLCEKQIKPSPRSSLPYQTIPI